MNNQYVDLIREKVKNTLSWDPARYEHSVAVAYTAACLAYTYNQDAEDAVIAGLLHDCAKCIADEELIHICKDNNIEITEYEYAGPYLLHAKVGAFHAKTIFQCDNENILSAIKYHTTGKPDMTMLERIVFLADYIEPYRNKASDLDVVRALAFKNINEAIYVVSRDTVEYLTKKNKAIDPLTIDTFKYYEINH